MHPKLIGLEFVVFWWYFHVCAYKYL